LGELEDDNKELEDKNKGLEDDKKQLLKFVDDCEKNISDNKEFFKLLEERKK
jgi:hypothetical protein